MRILVADDHAVVRAGLKTILSAREGWEICAEAGTGDEAVAFAKKYRPDVAILDLNMPGITGLEASAEIRINRIQYLVPAIPRKVGNWRHLLQGVAGMATTKTSA
jgi:DNA-binding NarL/FixJ family response regulator